MSDLTVTGVFNATGGAVTADPFNFTIPPGNPPWTLSITTGLCRRFHSVCNQLVNAASALGGLESSQPVSSITDANRSLAGPVCALFRTFIQRIESIVKDAKLLTDENDAQPHGDRVMSTLIAIWLNLRYVLIMAIPSGVGWQIPSGFEPSSEAANQLYMRCKLFACAHGDGADEHSMPEIIVPKVAPTGPAALYPYDATTVRTITAGGTVSSLWFDGDGSKNACFGSNQLVSPASVSAKPPCMQNLVRDLVYGIGQALESDGSHLLVETKALLKVTNLLDNLVLTIDIWRQVLTQK